MSQTTTRRVFLQQATWMGAGLWTCGSRVARGGSANEKLQVGLIGVGNRGEANLKAMSEEQIVALCDIDEQTLGKAAEGCPGARLYHDFRKMLDEQKDLDAVVVTIPDHTHAAATLLALRLGKHVYCEKPLTHAIDEARAVAQAAAQAGVATQMGNTGHSSENTRRAVELIRTGAIGAVREVHAWTNRPIWPQGIDRPAEHPTTPTHIHWDLWLGPAPERPYNAAYHPFKWRGWWDFGTGALGDMACHILDPAFWALKLRHPVSVFAESPPINPETAPPWSIIHFEFPARDEMPAVKLTWYDGGKMPPADLLEGQALSKGGGSLFVGEKGRLLVGQGRILTLLPVKDFADYQEPEPFLARSPGHHLEWIDACKKGGPTGSNFDYAGAMTESILLGNVALRAGRKIEWDGPNMRSRNGTIEDIYIHRPYRKGWEL
jgi:predicted dehydrogenase